MAYGEVLAALAHPTRRRIFEALRREPRSVGELAKEQPVSRPAVSQHLKVLESANLVRVEPQGTRRLYIVRREGLEELREYLETFWDETLAAFGDEIARRAKLRGQGDA